MDAKSGFRTLAIVVAMTLPWLILATAPNRAAEEETAVQVYKLNRADAERIAETVRSMFPGIKISVDETQNALVVDAPLERHKFLQFMLLKLDQRADVAEISENTVASMSDRELRRLVWQLHERVVQLEERTSFRILPVRER